MAPRRCPGDVSAFAVRSQHWRLVQPVGGAEGSKFDKTKLMLFDIQEDPHEMKDLAADNKVVAELKESTRNGSGMSRARASSPPRIVIGSDKEPVTVLSRQDMRMPGQAKAMSVGHWLLQIDKPGTFEFTATLPAALAKGRCCTGNSATAKRSKQIKIADKTAGPRARSRSIDLPAGHLRLEVWSADGDTLAACGSSTFAG